MIGAASIVLGHNKADRDETYAGGNAEVTTEAPSTDFDAQSCGGKNYSNRMRSR